MDDFLTKNTSLICPCCNQLRTNQDLTYLLKFDLEQRPIGLLRFIRCIKETISDWACDVCINGGKVILAKPDIQNAYGLTHPYFIYKDKNKNCEKCGNSFLFSAQEQQFWYENLKFIIWSTPTACKECRKQIRREKLPNKILTDLIPNLNTEDFEQLEQIIQQYLQTQVKRI